MWRQSVGFMGGEIDVDEGQDFWEFQLDFMN